MLTEPGGDSMKAKMIGIITVALCAGGIANPVLAGEVNGKGEPTPAGEKSASLCSYSGQQDDPVADEGFFRGDRVQSWGQIPKATRDFLIALEMFFHPGEGCNPNKPNPPL
jgi:hypothetical protein